MPQRFDLTAIALVITVAMLWIERGHRIVADAPTAAELAALAAARACPDSESVPYSGDCILFMQGDVERDMRMPVRAESRTAVPRPSKLQNFESASSTRALACPDNDNVPYSAGCLAFLAGRFWQPNTPSPE
jgi:hypothetical protein